MLPRGQILLETVKPRITRESVASDVGEVRSGGLATTTVAPAISMLVVAYRETDSLLRLLRTLAAAANTGVSCEIILVDNGLQPDIVAAALPLIHQYVKCQRNVGCSQGRNVGAAFCQAPLVAFVDADAEVDADYVEACIRALDDATLLAVRGRVVPRAPGGQLPTHYDLGPVAGRAPIAAEGASVWRTAPFCDAGGFEASLYGREGPVLCYRMHLLFGASASAFGYAPSIVLRHDYFESPQHLQSKLERNARIIDQVDRAYPMLRGFLAEFPAFGAKKRAALPVQVRSQAAHAKIRWLHRAATDAPLPVEPVAVHITSESSTDRARKCLAQQTVACAHVGEPGSSRLPANCTWQITVRGDDWLHPTLIERIGNVFRQYADVATIEIPRRGSKEMLRATRVDGASARTLTLAPPPVLIATYAPAEARVFDLAQRALSTFNTLRSRR